MSTKTEIRPSALAGRWYPADPKELAESVDSYIQAAVVPAFEGEVIALISPHAGHLYSGPIAGYGFAAIQDLEPELVVILSPYHSYHSGAILTSAHQAYQTPLGNIPVDQGTIDAIEKQLQKITGQSLVRVQDDEEHAVEILLPFFQRALKKPFQILPLMIRSLDPGLMKTLGLILARVQEMGQVLLTASTDLSHFHQADKARVLDQAIIDQITALDPEGLFAAQAEGQGSACGLAALAAVIWACRESGPARAHILRYAHSGAITGADHSVVGYTSAIITHG